MVEVTRAKKFLIVALKVVTLRWWQLSRELRSTYSRVTLPGVGILVKYIFSQIVKSQIWRHWMWHREQKNDRHQPILTIHSESWDVVRASRPGQKVEAQAPSTTCGFRSPHQTSSRPRMLHLTLFAASCTYWDLGRAGYRLEQNMDVVKKYRACREHWARVPTFR